MKICLVSPKGLADVELSIPHGLLQISAQLKKNGHDCEILDLNDPDVKLSFDYLRRFDIVGLSVMTTQLKHAVEIADALNGKVKIVWGGVHCLLDPLSIIQRFNNHFVISGDGEKPLLKLLDYFEGKIDLSSSGNEIGISYYLDKPIINMPFFVKDLNELENINYYDLPNFEKYLYDANSYFKKPARINTLHVLTSRGCSWDCSFCINSIYRQYKAFHRSKSINKIRQETEKVIDDFNVKVIILRDEDFFVNKDLVNNWARYAKEKGFLWGADCRYNYFKENMINETNLKDLVDAGLLFVGMSIEAGSEDLRNKLLNKQLKDVDIYKTVKIIARTAGDRLAINTSFIVNFPGDTKLNKIRTIKWMDYLSRNLNIGFSGPQIYRSYPGSKLYNLENRHEEGSLDYYFKNITEACSIMPSNMIVFFELLFYSNILPRYFNNKCRFFELQISGKSTEAKIINKKTNKLEWVLVSMIFFSIKLRLKFDYWGLFYDPFLIGLFFYPLQKIKKILRHNKK